MHVQKTFQHEGRTLAHGTFDVHETVWVCPKKCRHPAGKLVTQRPKAVVHSILPNSIVGYDLMVHVGCQRYLKHKQREEIRTQLNEKQAIKISSGEISRLARLFLVYLSRLHYSRANQLKAALERDGGWPMHVDATGEHGRGTLFVVMAGWRQWVLGAFKPATEKARLLVPCILKTIQHFGAPCAVMRDMGRAVTSAIDEVMETRGLTIPVFACHQHFLA